MDWKNLQEGDKIKIVECEYLTPTFSEVVEVSGLNLKRFVTAKFGYGFTCQDMKGKSWTLSVYEGSETKIEVVEKSPNINYSLNISEWEEYVLLINQYVYFRNMKDYEKSDNLRKELLLWSEYSDKEYLDMVRHCKYEFHVFSEDSSHSAQRLSSRGN
jgi:hypothetical protein